jgi:arylsulfatase A-like enzyme
MPSLSFIIAFVLLGGWAGITNAASPLIVVSIDGLRPDAIDKANALTLKNLIARGTHFVEARTVRPSITLPAHTSMITGLNPEQHGVTWDHYRAEYGPIRHVTALEIVNRAGFHTIMIVAKEKLIHLNRPGSVDYFEKTDKDGSLVANAFEVYVKNQGLPDLSFIHLPDPDSAGHVFLWNSPPYMAAVRDADNALARIIQAAKNASGGKEPTVLVTADHGGFAFGHLADIDFNNKVPLIAFGEGIPADVTKDDAANVYDLAPTILEHFKLPIPGTWLGRLLPIRTSLKREPLRLQPIDYN